MVLGFMGREVCLLCYLRRDGRGAFLITRAKGNIGKARSPHLGPWRRLDHRPGLLGRNPRLGRHLPKGCLDRFSPLSLYFFMCIAI